jgi:phospholipid/cholesterol/gamma-HCH transport system substrate-binding protein
MKLSKEFIIGVVVVLAIALLYLGVNYLKGVNLLARQQTYYAVYTNSAGLIASNPVILNGFKIGIVKDVYMSESGDGTIIAVVVLNDDNLKIPVDTELQIRDADLFGGKAIEVVLGKSGTLANNKDTLSSSVSMGLTESIKSEIEPLKQKTSELFASVDSILNSVNMVLNDANTGELGDIFKSLKATMQDLEGTSNKLNRILDRNGTRVDDILINVESISANLKNSNGTLTKAIKNVESFTDTLARLNLASTIKKVDRVMGEFAQISADINSGKGSLGKLVNNDSLHHELVNASHSLDLLLNDMRVHPSRYLSFSVFGGKKQAKDELSKKELEVIREEIDKAIEEKGK